jgi:LuxR family maltose regulon positive regulatory protein
MTRLVLETKLFRPPITPDLVPRATLLRELEARKSVPLTLVSAPAGYGKSTLVSWWLGESTTPSAWLSLDPVDDDLVRFVIALVAAVRTVRGDSCATTLGLVDTDPLPPVSSLAAAFCRDMTAAGHPMIVGLDDYHVIREGAVHDFLSDVLRHPSPMLHLVLMTRHDPPLPLAALRARGHLTEVRMDDLRFTDQEAETFLGNVTGLETDPARARHLNAGAEGWPAGLRLAASTRFAHGGPEADQFSGAHRFIGEYLIQEVLARESTEMQGALLRTSVPERLSVRLCDAILCGTTDRPAPTGLELLERAVQDNLFLIPLDDRGEWFRYHHLFRDLLRKELQRRYGPDARIELLGLAARWFENEGLTEDALHHYLAASNLEDVTRLVAKNGHELLNRERWSLLERWLRRVPQKALERDSELLALRAWSLENRFRIDEAAEVVHRIRRMFASGEGQVAQLAEELGALQCSFAYVDGDLPRCIELADRALDALPPARASERGYALILSCLARHHLGRVQDARDTALDALKDAGAPGTFRGRALTALCYVSWLEAEPDALERFAKRALEVAEDADLPETREFARYFLGIAAYDRDELQRVEAVLEPNLDRFSSNTNTWAHSCFAASAARWARGHIESANALTDEVAAHAVEVDNPALLAIAGAFRAELALRQGRDATAIRWATTTSARQSPHMLRFYLPETTYVKARLATGTTDDRAEATALADALVETVTRQNHRRFRIDALILRARVRLASGCRDGALKDVGDAVALAVPGQVFRPFLDAIDGLESLLGELDASAEAVGFVQQIMARGARAPAARLGSSGRADKGVGETAAGVDLLTDREIEIVGLLGERLSNKEIARRLFVSPETVKKHLFNVYSKLDVHGRREAFRKASELGIL